MRQERRDLLYIVPLGEVNREALDVLSAGLQDIFMCLMVKFSMRE
jgi:hypothetical protein